MAYYDDHARGTKRPSLYRGIGAGGPSSIGIVLALGVLILLGLMFFMGAGSSRDKGTTRVDTLTPITPVPRAPASTPSNTLPNPK